MEGSLAAKHCKNNDQQPVDDSVSPMTTEEFLEDRRLALRQSIDFFSGHNKTGREHWVCAEFLTNLGIAFSESDIRPPVDEPPISIFVMPTSRSRRFLAQGVADMRNTRPSFKRPLRPRPLKICLKNFTPQDITPLQVGERILAKLNEHALQQHYAPAVRTKLDLLFYVNLKKHFLQIGPMPPPAAFAPFGWLALHFGRDRPRISCFLC
jgi:hypothetical protein